MNRLVCVTLSVLLLSGCASYGKPTFKQSSKGYDKEYDQVWQAALNAVDDQPLDHADKTNHEISTKPTSAMVINGRMDRYTTIKIGSAKPYTIRVRVTATRVMGFARADTFSDEDAEQEILNKIDASLK